MAKDSHYDKNEFFRLFRSVRALGYVSTDKGTYEANLRT